MAGYAEDRAWSDRFIPEIKRIVGPLLLDVTPNEIDCAQAADLMVFTARDMRIAARVRRPDCLIGHPERAHEFTIRCHRSSGAETELSKIVNGWGDWFFYGHADSCEQHIHIWHVVDLHAFRAALIRVAMNGLSIRSGQKDNRDGTFFKWFDIRSFPTQPPLVIACSDVSARAAA